MLKKILLYIVFVFPLYLYAQHNMLGKSYHSIINTYNKDPEYILKVDTISDETILITTKTSNLYPYYTYEIDRNTKICISYGIVSKDKNTLETYIDVLDHLGELVEVDSSFTNMTYKIDTKNKISYYSIKQPFLNSSYISRRNIFYILITSEIKEIIEIE